MEPAPLWASSLTQYLLYKAQDPFSACRAQSFLNNFFSYCADNLVVGPVHASQIKKLGKRICRVEPAPLWGSSYTQYLLYKAQDPFSACRVQLFLNNFFFILCRQFSCRTSPCFTDQETQEENLQGGTSSLVGQFLHPISLVQSSRSIQRMQSAIVPKHFFFYIVPTI